MRSFKIVGGALAAALLTTAVPSGAQVNLPVTNPTAISNLAKSEARRLAAAERRAAKQAAAAEKRAAAAERRAARQAAAAARRAARGNG